MRQHRRALVTGASGGLGAAFARELAARGTALVLVARDEAALAGLGAELAGRHGVEVDVLPADLADPLDLARVERRLAGEDAPVDLLVNNAGVIGQVGPFGARDADVEEANLRLNVLAVLRLTRAAVGAMARRRHGGVINVSSAMGYLQIPGGATYAAAKAFVTSLSQTVHSEVRPLGVHVLALCPGSTRTNLHRAAGRRGRTLGRVREPEFVVREALAALAAGRPVHVPGREYQAKVLLARYAPRRLVSRLLYHGWDVQTSRRLAESFET
ncbi:short-chain dehydrogenase [Sphaerisporangium rufum]|uniref:Short-chain dehydrogenase n=1 Tax=Sphaerisporangium rufum TaxID=1381558 RepID=A0A919R7C8_9ACTN|nr:SDR family oxidoreductase [Sphaerisporangium rufum]GII80964.1 short-chain dehydrogenase [Sphaerisporangium rufum]